MLKATGVQQGSNVTPDWQSSVDYSSASSGGTTVYELWHSTQFQQDDVKRVAALGHSDDRRRGNDDQHLHF